MSFSLCSAAGDVAAISRAKERKGMRKNKYKEKVKGICVCVCLVISRSTGKLGLLVYCARPSTPCPHGNGRKAYRKKGKIHAKSKAATTKKRKEKGNQAKKSNRKKQTIDTNQTIAQERMTWKIANVADNILVLLQLPLPFATKPL